MIGVPEITDVTAVAGETTDQPTDGQFKAPSSQEELDRIIQSRLDRERKKIPGDYEELKAKAAKYAEIEEANKTEAQKLQEQLTSLQERAATAERDRERLSVIAKHAIPADFHDLVHGTDAAALEASAVKVKSLLQATTQANSQSASFVIPDEGGNPTLALNGDGIEAALKNALGIA